MSGTYNGYEGNKIYIYLNRGLVGKSAGSHMHRCELNYSIITPIECPATDAAGHSSQHNITQHGMLPQYPTGTAKLICDYFYFDFSKEYSSLMTVLGPKHVGAFLMF